MSLLQSHLRPAQLVVTAAVGCALSAGCAFDRAPRTSGGSGSKSGSAWMPPSAAAGGARASDTTDASAADAETDEAPDAVPPPAASAQVVQGRAGAAPPPPVVEKDAGRPRPPAQTKPDAGRPPEPEPEPDAATERDAAAPLTRCRPGVYSGTFSGSIQLIGLSLSSVTGTVHGELKADGPDGLDLRDGRVMGVDQDGNRLTCGLSGRINCTTNVFEEGKLEDGVYHNVASNTDTLFVGSAQATYSSEPFSVVGTFSVEAIDTVSLFGGKGTWSLIRSE